MSCFNNMLLKKLQKTLNKDSEMNLMNLFLLNYTFQLTEKKKKK
jgi:hypothetical protein